LGISLELFKLMTQHDFAKSYMRVNSPRTNQHISRYIGRQARTNSLVRATL
jgi:hypothetical protein